VPLAAPPKNGPSRSLVLARQLFGRSSKRLIDRMWAECGVGLVPPVPCYKQHTQFYRISALREPVNFADDIPRQAIA
jgi:hypothetical protein